MKQLLALCYGFVVVGLMITVIFGDLISLADILANIVIWCYMTLYNYWMWMLFGITSLYYVAKNWGKVSPSSSNGRTLVS